MRLDALQCLEDSDKLSVASVRTLFSVRKKFNFPLQTWIGKDSLQPSGRCCCSDARATLSGRGLNMETHEVRYGKAVTQFIVWTLYASVLTLPREIRINGDLGFLSL
jgi:hypothetical protein